MSAEHTLSPVDADLQPVSTLSPPHRRAERTTAICLCLLTGIAVIAVMAFLGPVIIPVLIAVFLYFVIRPLADFLHRWHIPRWLSYLSLMALLVGCIWLISQLVYRDAENFMKQLPKMQKRAETLWKQIPVLGQSAFDSNAIFEKFNVQLSDVYQQLFGTAWKFAESVLMVLFYLIFVLIDAERVPDRLQRAFPKQGARLLEASGPISDSISSYMKVKALIGAGMAVTSAIIMASFGLSSWLLWAFLTFLLNYITYIGSLIALGPPVLIALLTFQSWEAAVALGVLLGVNRFVWIDFLEIRYSGQQLRINNVLLLFSIIFWGWFWGVPGMVLAVPMLSTLKIILAHFERTRPWAILMSEE
ncbi:AI-2E family transporter [Planctomicrobium piriforme]|uniref:Predicted PurR-regulated permease PerM n=1 Tax=Planctomicrobium piriforme TaxID=1576369 RepID=A0A1I3AQJ4_9PLAN|nr:AI-2E family transporter [Planctomicrobium piriforme]SFH52240.1 Predicted PurR-regulated permease PerM [Planctomicrobium piriforme]